MHGLDDFIRIPSVVILLSPFQHRRTATFLAPPLFRHGRLRAGSGFPNGFFCCTTGQGRGDDAVRFTSGFQA